MQPPGPDQEAHAEAPATPSISLPKGGGAIKGIGEKFAANPVTGTGSMTVPIAVSPGRSGFGPELSLSYDSGSGNGPFGFGWSLSLPSITRKTDKGLPRYVDGEESDVVVLSGAEDLVPVLTEDGTRHVDTTSAPGWLVHRYRPRVEGLFARIERWVQPCTGQTHWRSISRDNVTTLYGATEDSRISDGSRVFSWLICHSFDDEGNAIVYDYLGEDGTNVDLSSASERNRSRGANRYLKRIRYGNRVSRLVQPDLTAQEWLFEVVFDYGEGHHLPVPPDPALPVDAQLQRVQATAEVARGWAARPDPFSTHRAGFEVRTHRRCQRILMFHHIRDLPTGEEGYDGLVRCTEFDYADLDLTQPVTVEEELAHQGSTRCASFIRRVTQSGYVRDDTQPVVVRDGVEYATYKTRSLPPLEFEYSKPAIQDQMRELDADSLGNLPAGIDDSTYQLVDLDSGGAPGILTEQAGAWFYKPNQGGGRFGPLETVPAVPSLAALGGGRQQLLDLAGDGQLDLVALSGPTPGFYERTPEGDWAPFRTFRQLPAIAWDDPNLRFTDLDGDGHADVLITEQDAFTWHLSLAEDGFGPAQRVAQLLDEERGPRLVFADGTQSVYLADMSGDGLTDLVRIRNGHVCYWPNQGYGRFGAKITLDNGPWFDHPDQFDQRRIRLADIDGSGTTDIIYLHRGGVRLYFNQSGNRLTEPRHLDQFPPVDNVTSVLTADLLGNGTACLVWSSPLPADTRRPIRYLDLMGGTKPHLLVKSVNNLGAETEVNYAPSTQFYLADKRAGRPWVTRLPFPVQVVERVVTHNRISGNRFVTRYAYHHGYFDGTEREFRGFGMVEQWDTEQYATLAGGQEPVGTNIDAASHVPPVLTRTWFHTGAYFGREHISNVFAGLLDPDDVGEYYREPGLPDARARALLLDDTVLPAGLTPVEEREVCRALKGSMLRQEIYAEDGTDEAEHPYTVTEQNFVIRVLQSRGSNRHGVFLTHPRESISYHYERRPADPRISHALTLEVDDYGNILKQATIGYGRRQPNPNLRPEDQAKQAQILATYTENRVTNAVDTADDHRTPLPCETLTHELTGVIEWQNDYQEALEKHFRPRGRERFSLDEILDAGSTAITLGYEQTPATGRAEKRLIEHVRTYYRRDNLTGPLPLGELQALALPYQSYKLAFTPGLVAQVYDGRVTAAMLADDGRYVRTESDAGWWIPSGQAFYSPHPGDTAAQELEHAREHFFLPHRYRDPFHTIDVSTESFVTYDTHDLLVEETRDALDNRVTVGERDPDPNQPQVRRGQDYRVLQPALVMDPNRNRSVVAFDALGMVVGTAVMGKPAPATAEGDSLDGFTADLTQAEIDQFLADPKGPTAATLLADATTRIVYDLTASWRQPDPTKKPPAVTATLARETHVSDLPDGQQSKIQVSLSYSDGFSREIQKKNQAEPGRVPQRDTSGKIIAGVDGQPLMTPDAVSPRWVGSGWTVFNNKGKPVRQYEPFFTDTHRFEFDVKIGVSPVLFYDPVERVVATLHPNHTWEKVVFDPWQQTSYDVNDTCAPGPAQPGDPGPHQTGDPRTDPDIGRLVAGFVTTQPATWQTWHAQRIRGELGGDEQRAAERAAAHADTPTTAHLDALGRPFLTVARNRVTCPGHDLDGTEGGSTTRVELDIEGNQRAVRDAIQHAGDRLGRIVMCYDYDLLGNRIHQLSMEAGARWMLNDVAGKPIRTWDSRGHDVTTTYDALRRPVEQTVRGTTPASDPRTLNRDILVDRIEYGEDIASAELLNLRTRVYRHFDSAGVVTNARLNAAGHPTGAYDFKGNLQHSTRRLASDYAAVPDWRLNPQLDDESFEGRTRYDALNRPIQSVAPRSSLGRGKVNVIQSVFNEANLLERVDVWLEADAEPTGLLNPAGEVPSPVGVAGIDYDAKGQRLRIDYKNGATTSYRYDPLTFRLTHLLTQRKATDFPGDDPQPPIAGWPGKHVQNLHYTYDPAGNITHIRDDAQQTIYFANRRVEPSNDYIYDALYRLIHATGREHLGQGGAPIAHSHDDAGRVGILSADAAGRFAPNDGNAMGAYIERYVYDAVGNLLQMQHRGSHPAQAGWTRAYHYLEPSLIEDGNRGRPRKTSNRLTHTTLNPAGNTPQPEDYLHDAHGNMLHMPHLGGGPLAPNMHWDYTDQLRQTDLIGGGTAHYVYDAAGQRVRKVWQKAPGLVEERIYLDGFEIFRKHRASIGANSVVLERETLHVMDDKQRIALVETRSLDTQGDDRAPRELIRYQLGNHLGSASLELDEWAQIVSYEEYAPYGSTTYQAVRSRTETAKRYCYTGKERDEESGLHYFGARYYAQWLARWTSCDPAGIDAGSNLWLYVAANPIGRVDPDGRDWLEFMKLVTSPPTPGTPLHNQAKDAARYGAIRGARAAAIASALPFALLSTIAMGELAAAVPILGKLMGLATLGGALTSGQPTIVNAAQTVQQFDPTSSSFDPPAAVFTATMLLGGLGASALRQPRATTGLPPKGRVNNSVEARPLIQGAEASPTLAPPSARGAQNPVEFPKGPSSVGDTQVASSGGTWSGLPLTPAAEVYAARFAESGRTVPLDRGSLSLRDLGTLASNLEREVAVVRIDGERQLILGVGTKAEIPQGAKLIAHVHPGEGFGGLKPSSDDIAALTSLEQRLSTVINESGAWRIFSEKGGSGYVRNYPKDLQ